MMMDDALSHMVENLLTTAKPIRRLLWRKQKRICLRALQ